MHLTPHELDKLTLHQAGFLAQKRLARGVRLNHPETIALIATQIMAAPSTSRMFPTMDPTIDAFTTSWRPARNAASAMMSSAALPGRIEKPADPFAHDERAGAADFLGKPDRRRQGGAQQRRGLLQQQVDAQRLAVAAGLPAVGENLLHQALGAPAGRQHLVEMGLHRMLVAEVELRQLGEAGHVE